MEAIAWPQKTRELQMWAFDSTRWNGFEFRPDDVVVATYAKSGTHWMQQIVSLLVFQGDQDHLGAELSPWPDFRFADGMVEKARAQSHRRFLKTHLPVDALVYSREAKYIYVGRDGRDVYWSWHNHHMNMKPEALAFLSSFPERAGAPPYGYPDQDIRRAFLDWLDRDSFPQPPFFEHIKGWWGIRALPNILFVHFNDLKSDLETEARRVAEFLEIEVPATVWPTILERCSFAWMRQRAASAATGNHPVFNDPAVLFNKGTNARWRDVLTADDIAYYESLAARKLPPDCARWLASGRSAANHA